MKKLLVILFLTSFAANAQKVNLDSLWGVWNDPEQADTNKLKAMRNIAWNGYLFTQPDSAFYFAQMQYDKAEKKGEKKYMAVALNTQGVSFAIRGNSAKAIDYFTQSLKIYEEIEDKQFIAKSLNNIGLIYYKQDDNSKAIDYYTQSLIIQEEIGDKKGIAGSLYAIGLIYYNLGDYAKAIDYYTQSLIIQEEIGDKKGIAKSLNSIGTICNNQGYYSKAIDYYTQSLKIKEEIGDKKGIANSANNIGLIYYNLGDYSKAIDYYTQSLKTQEEIGYKKGIANSLNNIGLIYNNLGDYSKAIDYYTQSLKIKEEIGDKNGIAGSLNNIGAIYYNLGDYSKANDYYTQSLKIYEEIGDKKGIASSLSNFGGIHKHLGDYSKAIDYYTQSLKISEEIGDKKSTAGSLNNIGAIYYNLGDYSKANDYYTKGLQIYEEIGDKKDIAKPLNNIGAIYKDQGDYGKAIDYYSRSLALVQEIEAAPETQQACLGLLRLYIILDSLKEAPIMANLIREHRLKDLRINFSTLSEQQKELYFSTMQGDFDLLYDFALNYPGLTLQSQNAFNNTLITKGLLLKSSTAMRNAVLSSEDSTLITQYEVWIALKHRIAKAYSEGGDIKELEDQANELEKELVKGSQEFSDIKKVQELTWKDVQSGLKEGESAIEFVRFTRQEDYRNDSDKVQLYAALIIDSECEHPTMVRLFEEPELEKILGTFPGNNLSYIEQVYGTKENTKSQLYNLIWKPMEEALGDAKKVYVSPVGLLHKISFAALAKEQDVFLCDLYDIEMKSSTGKIALSADDNALVTEAEQSEGTRSDKATTTLFGGIQYNSDSTSTEIWQYLDGSLSETQQIEKILKQNKVSYNYFNQNNATEAQFKEIASKSNILHIATHGFFYPDPDLALEEMIDVEETEEPINFRGGRQGVGVNTFVKSRNPLMRSGLAFAGANDVWNRTNIEGEDGVLTAAEVATIDMRNTDLVVLSACETGLGDIKGSEGVYGLQRSFKMAGVNYLIMSLWQVPDKETAEFMTTFYKHLTKTNDIKQSFNLTQKAMRKKYDPYYWAAFVLVE